MTLLVFTNQNRVSLSLVHSGSSYESNKGKDLRSISQEMAARYPTLLKAEEKLCSGCRKRLPKASDTTVDVQPGSPTPTLAETVEEHESASPVESQAAEQVEEECLSPEVALATVNDTLSLLGQSPVKKRRMSASYVTHKLSQIQTAVREQLVTVGFPMDGEEESGAGAKAIIACLKDKFNESKLRSEKVKILTIFGTSWTIRTIMSEFRCSQRMASQAVQLAKESGILTSPNPKRGRPLPVSTKALVKSFYRDDEISRPMPGKKDFLSVREGGEKVHLQKRLLLCNLKEVYQQFVSRYQDVKVGFSTFADLRPRECVIAGSSGTHSVCVCTIHQNVKLMMVGARMEDFDAAIMPLKEYSDVLTAVRCNPFHPRCALGECTSCPGPDRLREVLLQSFEDKAVDEVQYKQWTCTDRSQLETFVQPVEEYVEAFLEKIEALSRHDFIAKQQSRYCKDRKEALQAGEFLVVGDFSENYSFIVQDAVQGYHWTNSQATLHPFVFYWKDQNKELQHSSYVVISECNNHDTVAVHLFQRHLIEHLKSKHQVTKIIYFSDGCAGQYKNCKNFINLCYHLEDFAVPAEWHFFATSHGKGPCDGVGGVVKRQAAKASLQRVFNEQITTPLQLFTFCQTQLQGITFRFLTTKDWSDEDSLLQERLSRAKTIAGTQRLHSFVPISTTALHVREYSASCDVYTENVQVAVSDNVNICDVKGYATAVYGGNWWVAYVTGTDPEMQEVTLSFLHPHGPSKSFYYPHKPDILTVHISDILTLVDPVTSTGRTYSLTDNEMDSTAHALLSHIH